MRMSEVVEGRRLEKAEALKLTNIVPDRRPELVYHTKSVMHRLSHKTDPTLPTFAY